MIIKCSNLYNDLCLYMFYIVQMGCVFTDRWIRITNVKCSLNVPTKSTSAWPSSTCGFLLRSESQLAITASKNCKVSSSLGTGGADGCGLSCFVIFGKRCCISLTLTTLYCYTHNQTLCAFLHLSTSASYALGLWQNPMSSVSCVQIS